MAAPTPTARQLPTGYALREGFRIQITMANAPAIAIWEQTVKPFGESVGDAIDTTTQHNVQFRTKAPPKLVEHEEVTGTATYDPDARTTIRGQLGKEQVFTITNPDSSTDCFFGFMSKVEFSEHKTKELPTLNYTIVVTNWDPTGKVEAGPVHTPSAGT